MHQTLYRKYRPQTFSEVCGQERITSVLRRQIAEETYTHAYLFAGTRGTGKTSCAKIFAKAVNCEHPVDGEPCNECETCRAITEGKLLDVLEVDAASHNGVDDIRDLCEKIDFLPAQGKKRVYIIDEVHMLSISAFNALLKTLEEPPAHALFILATTEPGKVPATIRSRCQIFSFGRIAAEDIARRVLFVAKREQIELSETGAHLIARLSDGAMRDALSLLELCVGHKAPLDDEELVRLFGLGKQELITQFAVCAAKGDEAKCFSLLDELYRDLGNLKEVLTQVLGAFHDMLLYAAHVPFETRGERTDALQDDLKKQALPMSADEILYLIGVVEDALMQFERLAVNKKILTEFAIVRLCRPSLNVGESALEARVSALERKLIGNPQAVSAHAPKEASVKEKPVREMPEKAEPEQLEEKAPAQKGEQKAQNAIDGFSDKLIAALSASDPPRGALYKILSFRRSERVLRVYGPPYSIAMFTPKKQEFLDAAKKLDSELVSVELISGDAPRPQENDLDDLASF